LLLLLFILNTNKKLNIKINDDGELVSFHVNIDGSNLTKPLILYQDSFSISGEFLFGTLGTSQFTSRIPSKIIVDKCF
jgi:hypothetical protein